MSHPDRPSRLRRALGTSLLVALALELALLLLTRRVVPLGPVGALLLLLVLWILTLTVMLRWRTPARPSRPSEPPANHHHSRRNI